MYLTLAQATADSQNKGDSDALNQNSGLSIKAQETKGKTSSRPFAIWVIAYRPCVFCFGSTLRDQSRFAQTFFVFRSAPLHHGPLHFTMRHRLDRHFLAEDVGLSSGRSSQSGFHHWSKRAQCLDSNPVQSARLQHVHRCRHDCTSASHRGDSNRIVFCKSQKGLESEDISRKCEII